MVPEKLLEEKPKKKRCPELARKYRNAFRERNPDYHKNYERQRRKKNPELAKGHDLKKHYWPDLTGQQAIEEYNRMRAAQNNKCAICEIEGKVLHVDHDHNTGRVRSLLCGNCNTALGLIKESANIAEKLKFYIEKVCK